MRSTISPPFDARRMALVPLARNSVAPAASPRSRNRRTVATAWSAAVGGIEPWRLTTSPRRSISFTCTNGSRCPSACTSATRRWNEFDPRSMAATRIAPKATGGRRYVGHTCRREPSSGWSRTVRGVDGSALAPPARFQAMGTDVEVLALGADRDAMAELGALAADALEAREARWSRFRPSSELCRLNDAGGAPVVVSTDTFALIARAVDAWRTTAGRYDPTVLAALEAAGYDRDFDAVARSGAAAVDDGADVPGCAGVELDDLVSAVRLPADVTLDLGGIGKGFAADEVSAELLGA